MQLHCRGGLSDARGLRSAPVHALPQHMYTMSNVPRVTLTFPPRAARYDQLDEELFRLTLSEENKEEIFEYGLEKLSQSQQEASFVLQNLERWDPHTRSMFSRRSSTTILKTPFRLVFPNPDLASFDGSCLYVRQYMAVSYCWRSEDFLPEGYERDGSWPISRPFVDAIISEKNHPRVGIWMDQLCIDQTSTADKQSSVAAMDVIYRSCIRLLVLLEDVTLDAQEAALCERYDPSRVRFERGWTPPVSERAIFDSFHDKVHKARWWQRAWCFHEFNVNEPWSDRRQSNEIHNATFIMNGPGKTILKIKWWTLHYIMASATPLSSIPEILTPIDMGDREPGWRSSLMARHNGLIRKGCMNLEDKLSIMINMCGLGLAYHGPALSEPNEVLYISALIALAAGEVYPLTMFNGRTTFRLSDRPTWFQRHIAADDISIPRFRPGELYGIHRISVHEIELDMIFLPPPAVWQKVRDGDLKPTFDIFPDVIATTSPATHGEVDKSITSASLPDDDLDKPRRSFLAGCILNGHAFTAGLWTQLKRDVVGPNYNQGLFKDLAADPSLYSAANRLLTHLFPISKLLSIPAPPTFTLDDAHLFLTWLTDPRSMYYISVYTYRIQCTMDGEEAFTTGAQANEQFHDGPAEELRAAVPTDLLTATCIPLRVWFLRPCQSGDVVSSWRLVGKAMLLGESDLMAEARASQGKEGAVVKLKRAIVGG